MVLSASPVPLLAIDCSTEQLCLAVAGPGGHALWAGPGGAQASGALLEQASRMLAAQGLSFASLGAVAFGKGPGAFTGLRTACAVAQGLGWAARCPLLALDSLLIVAEAARLQRGQLGAEAAPDDIGVVMDARMGEAYAGRYRWTGHGWLAVEPPALVAPAALALAWQHQPPTWACGNGWPLLAPAPASMLVELDDQARCQGLLGLALQACSDPAQRLPAAQALPLYLRDKVALTTQERTLAAAAAAAKPAAGGAAA